MTSMQRDMKIGTPTNKEMEKLIEAAQNLKSLHEKVRSRNNGTMTLQEGAIASPRQKTQAKVLFSKFEDGNETSVKFQRNQFREKSETNKQRDGKREPTVTFEPHVYLDAVNVDLLLTLRETNQENASTETGPENILLRPASIDHDIDENTMISIKRPDLTNEANHLETLPKKLNQMRGVFTSINDVDHSENERMNELIIALEAQMAIVSEAEAVLDEANRDLLPTFGDDERALSPKLLAMVTEIMSDPVVDVTNEQKKEIVEDVNRAVSSSTSDIHIHFPKSPVKTLSTELDTIDADSLVQATTAKCEMKSAMSYLHGKKDFENEATTFEAPLSPTSFFIRYGSLAQSQDEVMEKNIQDKDSADEMTSEIDSSSSISRNSHELKKMTKRFPTKRHESNGPIHFLKKLAVWDIISESSADIDSYVEHPYSTETSDESLNHDGTETSNSRSNVISQESSFESCSHYSATTNSMSYYSRNSVSLHASSMDEQYSTDDDKSTSVNGMYSRDYGSNIDLDECIIYQSSLKYYSNDREVSDVEYQSSYDGTFGCYSSHTTSNAAKLPLL